MLTYHFMVSTNSSSMTACALAREGSFSLCVVCLIRHRPSEPLGVAQLPPPPLSLVEAATQVTAAPLPVPLLVSAAFCRQTSSPSWAFHIT